MLPLDELSALAKRLEDELLHAQRGDWPGRVRERLVSAVAELRDYVQEHTPFEDDEGNG